MSAWGEDTRLLIDIDNLLRTVVNLLCGKEALAMINTDKAKGSRPSLTKEEYKRRCTASGKELP